MIVPYTGPNDRRFQQARWPEPLIFEKAVTGATGHIFPPLEPEVLRETGPLDRVVPAELRRSAPPLIPNTTELQVIRHYTRLSQMNFAVTLGTYPLGSCTMKYNPVVNERNAALRGFSWLHPLQDVRTTQGALELMWELERWLAEITGMDAVTLQPAAGAHGEFTGVMLMREYHKCVTKECAQRTEMLIPDAAHGTNPASAAMAGYEVVVIPSNADGLVDLDALKSAAGPKTAGLMLTNPNTIGVFEKNIEEIAGIVHDVGGLLYYDGANFNAIMGITRPGDMGFDVVHLNLHKTFSTPHGGGGPGAGAVAVKERLAEFLPVPRIVRLSDGRFDLNYDLPRSIGKVHSFYGNFGVLVRAYSYIYALGRQGLRRASEVAVLNANYVAHHVRQIPGYTLPFSAGAPRMHECVLSAEQLKTSTGVSAMNVAKRLLDFGIHAPTVYFPLIVPEGLMIEPTESESREELDYLIASLKQVSDEAHTNPDAVTGAPHSTAIGHLDEYRAAHPKTMTLSWRMQRQSREADSQ
ncbi:MAG: aminomethyl-transferring glycine dehydrogenase subunit GcvPB [Candidatus Thorarchaeota archaeon]|nr:aminomethyl-transferring glycine dehydrogenase subunit GcvPB [Candidatus Thorarchaeota archaeon]